MSSKKGFTLLEILITAVIIIVLAALVLPRVLHQVRKAEEAEAIVNLGAIRRAQLDLHGISGRFVEAADEKGIQAALGLSISNLIYDFKIIDADEDNFLGVATPIDALENWLEEIKIDKDGFVGYPGYGDGGGSSGGSGGGSSGGGSGSGGGSSGSGSGGGSGSSGGSSGGCAGTRIDNVFYQATVKPVFNGYAANVQVVLDTLALMTDPLTADGMVTGKDLVEWLQRNEIPVAFGSIDSWGLHYSSWGRSGGIPWIASEIKISTDLQSNKYACAATLAHEVLHATWWLDDYGKYFWLGTKAQPDYGMPTPTGEVRSKSSVDQEYNAFVTGSEIWSWFKRSGYD
ncbi:MAG TPA: type II secretion system protein, partial [Candidatus Omnitrophota bacterium]|nr:type II secretion system protein [Candidatus Omnitrophota bacterium]